MIKFSTIGYEGATVSQFMSCLLRNNVEIVIDVREHPVSRKPGFSQGALQKKLTDYNIYYKHFVSLGCPDIIRDRYKETGDWNFYTREYNKFLINKTHELEQLYWLFKGYYCSLLCFEADPLRCHRSLIAHELLNMYGDLTAVTLAPNLSSTTNEQTAQTRLCFSA